MTKTTPSRDDLASMYLDQMPYAPYPVQEEALLAWFSEEQGVLVCAPTGTGKTLIAEAALFEALHTGQIAYYTTPLIALTEQKFREMQAAAVRWGFSPDDIGLVTGNRRVNPEARILVVVAEILLNRLLHPSAFDFSDVAAVVMDEFHSFSDPERGIVWELSLALLPKHVRLLLLSATVGNTAEFLIWLNRSHQRRLQLVQGTERKVPLRYEWVGEQLLNEQIVHMAEGDETLRRTPALLFCFNREQCWAVAEQLRGKSLLHEGQQKQLAESIDRLDWSAGAGPKLKQILMRGVGVHHAGVLPRYRRIVEELFQRKLLSVCVCTETLAAGINLPARSVVLTSLIKGPPGRKKLIDASSAHQMFGRAGRPQFDQEGYVYVLAHEDDVKIARFMEKYNSIPEDTRDPLLIKKKKQLKKKMPTRRKTEQYWNEEQFEKLRTSPPGKLESTGHLPWRLLAYLLTISPEVDLLRKVVSKRLMNSKQLEDAQKELTRMLLTLSAGGYVELSPPPPEVETPGSSSGSTLAQLLGMSAPASQPKSEDEHEEDDDASSIEPASVDEDDEFGKALFEEAEEEQAESSVQESPATEPAGPAPSDREENASAAAQGTAPEEVQQNAAPGEGAAPAASVSPPPARKTSGLGALIQQAIDQTAEKKGLPKSKAGEAQESGDSDVLLSYLPTRATPTSQLHQLLVFKSVNPLYGAYLLPLLGIADRHELIQILESVLEIPGSMQRLLRVPKPDILPPGNLARTFVDEQIVQRGILPPGDLYPAFDPDIPFEERKYPPVLADKVRMLFDHEFPGVHSLQTRAVWAAGDLLEFGGKFDNYVKGRQLQKQEGIVFRHLLRLILLCEEFAQLSPPQLTQEEWRERLREISDQLAESCRAVDPESTDKMLEAAHNSADVVAETL